MRIGILGSGRIGGTLGRLWVRAGHEVMFASRHPEALESLVAEIGGGASPGTFEEAATFGDAVLLAVPFHAVAFLADALGDDLAGRVVLDATNPIPSRDGQPAEEVAYSGRGSGHWNQALLPRSRLVKVFNTVHFEVLRAEAHRHGERLGVPVAGSDAAAVEVAAQLVRDAGFEPLVVGPLVDAVRFDPDTVAWGSGMTARELRRVLDLG